MLVKHEVTIDGKIVHFESDIQGLKVYSSTTSDDITITFYFIKGDKVIKTLNINADCGQNCGFISGIDWQNIE